MSSQVQPVAPTWSVRQDTTLKTEQRLAEIFVELADTLVDEFDALDFFCTL